MASLKYEVAFVTPAFPGGTDPKTTEFALKDFEGIRPSSIIYGLRFWFRALAGSVLGTGQLDNLRRAESYLFGTAQYKGFAARVSVAVTHSAAEHAKPFTALEESANRDYTLRYLAYGLYPTNFKDKWQRFGLPDGTAFEFVIDVCSAQPPRAQTPLGIFGTTAPLPSECEITDLVRQLTLCWITMGGLGARWRHGLASMRLLAVNGEPHRSPPADQTLRNVASILSAASKSVRRYLEIALPGVECPGEAGTPEFPIAAPRHFKIVFRPDPFRTPREALRFIHATWRKTRVKNPADSRSTSRNSHLYAAFLAGSPLSGRRAEFAGLGLPIPFGFPKGGPGVRPGSTGHLSPADHGKTRIERRASPVWFRVVKIADNRSGILSILWKCRYLPENQVVLKRSGSAAESGVTVAVDADEADIWFRNLARHGFKGV